MLQFVHKANRAIGHRKASRRAVNTTGARARAR